MSKKGIMRAALVTAGILLIPFVAMQFTSEVQWTAFDFLVMGILLFATGAAYDVVSSKGGSTAYRAATFMAVSTALLLLWVNVAVGIIGNEGQSANLLYLAVLLVLGGGMVIARFKAEKMFWVLCTVALVQMLVPVVAMIAWPGLSWGNAGIVGVFMLNAVFAALWIGSALLYRHAGEPSTPHSVAV